MINSSLHCFELQQHDTLCYDRDYMAYKIEIPHMAQATELICADKLVDFTQYYRFTHKDMECPYEILPRRCDWVTQSLRLIHVYITCIQKKDK